MSGIFSSSVSCRLSISISLFNRYIPYNGALVIQFGENDREHPFDISRLYLGQVGGRRDLHRPGKTSEIAFQTDEVNPLAAWLLPFYTFHNEHIAADTQGDVVPIESGELDLHHEVFRGFVDVHQRRIFLFAEALLQLQGGKVIEDFVDLLLEKS